MSRDQDFESHKNKRLAQHETETYSEPSDKKPVLMKPNVDRGLDHDVPEAAINNVEPGGATVKANNVPEHKPVTVKTPATASTTKEMSTEEIMKILRKLKIDKNLSPDAPGKECVIIMLITKMCSIFVLAITHGVYVMTCQVLVAGR